MAKEDADQTEQEILSNVRFKTDAIAAALKRIVPELGPEMVGALSADLGDFWEIGERHRIRVEQIISLSGEQDRTKLAKLLGDLHYRDLMAHVPFHYKSMRRILPGVIDLLEAEQK